MARNYVTKIETNLKIGGTATLGPKTLIVGPNRSGKSTLVNGIEAAGTGRVSDVAGRATLAKDADLSMLGDSIFARATLDSGETCAWYLEKGHRAKRIGPEIAFPLRDAREALLGEPDKARRWILQHGGAFEWGDVEQLVADDLRRKLRSIVWDEVLQPTPADRLAGAIDDAKQRVRECRAAAKNKPAAPAGPPPTDEEIRAAEDAVTKFAAVGHLATQRNQLSSIDAEVATITANIKKLEAKEETIGADLLAIPPSAPVSDLVRAALLVAETTAKAKAKSCAICGAPTDPAALAKRAAAGRMKVDADLQNAEKRATLERARETVRGALTQARGDLARLEAHAEGIRIVIGSAEIPEGSVEEARRALTALHTRRAAWKAVKSAETDALQAERDSLAWAQLVEALSGALKQLVERARVEFEERVQAYLPAGWRFGVDLTDGDREVLRVGLRRAVGEPVRAGLSGVEWATVSAALALATAPENGPVIITPEDRAFDPVTLRDVLTSLGGVDSAQVIVLSPIDPAGGVPDGWTVVRTGGEAAPVVAPTVAELAAMERAGRTGTEAGPAKPSAPAPEKVGPVSTGRTTTEPVPQKDPPVKRGRGRPPKPKNPEAVDLDDLL